MTDEYIDLSVYALTGAFLFRKLLTCIVSNIYPLLANINYVTSSKFRLEEPRP